MITVPKYNRKIKKYIKLFEKILKQKVEYTAGGGYSAAFRINYGNWLQTRWEPIACLKGPKMYGLVDKVLPEEDSILVTHLPYIANLVNEEGEDIILDTISGYPCLN